MNSEVLMTSFLVLTELKSLQFSVKRVNLVNASYRHYRETGDQM